MVIHSELIAQTFRLVLILSKIVNSEGRLLHFTRVYTFVTGITKVVDMKQDSETNTFTLELAVSL